MQVASWVSVVQSGPALGLIALIAVVPSFLLRFPLFVRGAVPHPTDAAGCGGAGAMVQSEGFMLLHKGKLPDGDCSLLVAPANTFG